MSDHGPGPEHIAHFTLRANYPNVHTRLADIRGAEPRGHLPGYTPATVEYQLTGANETHQIMVRGVDIPMLNDHDQAKGKHYLSLLLAARDGDNFAAAEMTSALQKILENNEQFASSLDLTENAFVVPHTSRRKHVDDHVSHKGANLLNLSRQGYPVPDFCILTTGSFADEPAHRADHLRQALNNLEQMTGRQIGSAQQPLILALRYAMPSYIPGLMPTYLNAGLTREIHTTLGGIYGIPAAGKMHLNNLKNLVTILREEESSEPCPQGSLLPDETDLAHAIATLEQEIARRRPELLDDAFAQIHFLDRSAYHFFAHNQDLILTLSQGRDVRPALILQVMICTVRGQESYPGVLYSRNPNTGRHRMVETVPGIFGEDIMTGTVTAEVAEFVDREEIKEPFPALYHFEPSLPNLEKDHASPVTAEFASESIRQGNFFALLQINESEMTGRAALVSAMDLYGEKCLEADKVAALVRPFHLRQIMSETIDKTTFAELDEFCTGYSILPRSAASARIYFSTAKARAAKAKGETVCLCLPRFQAADAVAIEKSDIILSLDPAAIHLITTCRGHGTLAFLDLASHGVRLEAGHLINRAGTSLAEGDWVTVSSKRKIVYRGKARFAPARLHQYLQGEHLELDEREQTVFPILQDAFDRYHKLLDDLRAEQVATYTDLVHLVQADLTSHPDWAGEMINRWYGFFPDAFVDAVLAGELGTHRKQELIFRLLTQENQVSLMRGAVRKCRSEGRCGLTAGSFMLGRFLAGDHPVSFWNQLSDGDIAFLMNEWVQYRQYREVLYKVGEHHIARARTILQEGRAEDVPIEITDVREFIRLKLSRRDLKRALEAVDPEAKNATREMLEKLRAPYGEIYQYNQNWSLNPFKLVCEKEGLPLPGEDEI